MIRVTVENIKQLFLKTGQFQQIPDDTFTTIQGSIMYEQRINNVEQAVQNYLMIHGEVEEQ